MASRVWATTCRHTSFRPLSIFAGISTPGNIPIKNNTNNSSARGGSCLTNWEIVTRDVSLKSLYTRKQLNRKWQVILSKPWNSPTSAFWQREWRHKTSKHSSLNILKQRNGLSEVMFDLFVGFDISERLEARLSREGAHSNFLFEVRQSDHFQNTTSLLWKQSRLFNKIQCRWSVW